MLEGKDLIVFDVDGVLIDTVPGMIEGVRQVCLQTGTTKSEQFYRDNASNVHLARDLFPDDIQMQRRAEEIYITTFNESKDTPKLIEGVKEVLERILDSGRIIAFLSGKERADIDRVMKSYGIHSMASAIYGRYCLNNLKPDPEGLLKLMNDFSFQSNGLLMIGDDLRDLGCAQNAGVDFLGVDTGTVTSEKWDELGIKHINSVRDLI